MKSVAQSEAKRRLAAILAADMVGYSRLMETAEAATLARLKAHRAELIDPLLAEHDGRLIKLMGDGALIEFPSVVEAVACAIEIQRGMAARQAGCPEADIIRFRIGINLGDVLIDGDDVYGEGVNIAARLEALADPGGIVVSAAAYEQVAGKVAATFRDLGERTVKNIARPVHIFALRWDEEPLRSRAAIAKPWARAMTVVATVALAGAAGTTVWLAHREAAAPTPGVPLPLAERPAVAVLPFTNLADASQGYFSNGLTEDIAGALAKFGELAVIQPSALPASGEGAGAQEVWRHLGVRYVVKGTVRRDGDRLRVTAQLLEAGDGTIRWSQRYETALADIFGVQDDITRQLAGAMAVRLAQLEQQRIATKPPGSLEVYDLVLRGRQLTAAGTRSANLEARRILGEAVSREPSYAPAQVALGWALLDYALNGWTEFREDAVAEAEHAAHAALAIDPDLAGGHAVLGNVYLTRKQYEFAVAELDRALAANPSDARSYETRGDVLIWSGEPQAAIASLEAAQRLNPEVALGNLGVCYYLLGRYAEAVATLSRELPKEPAPMSQATDLAYLAAAYAQLGDMRNVERTKAALGKVAPFFERELFISQYRSEADRQRLRDGLAKAGIAG